MSRLRYIAVRAGYTVLLLAAVITLLFFFFRALPGSYLDILRAEGASQGAIETYEAAWGLDEPIYVQYFMYITNFVQLDMGQTLQYSVPVWDYVSKRIVNTVVLVLPGLTVGYIIGTTLGTYLGSVRGTRIENAGVFGLVLIGSLPRFFVAILAVIVFGINLDIFPTGGMLSAEGTALYDTAAWWRSYFTLDFLYHWTLPFLVTVLIGLYPSAMVMRTSVVEVSGQDFMYYNTISGLPYATRMVRMAHHAILPVITLYPISLGQAISGLVLIEFVFNWPGIGFTLIEAVFARDYPVVQFVFFVTATFVILANFAIDILYGVIDPRIAVGE
jgi:peptide/nickel transport system permease protein